MYGTDVKTLSEHLIKLEYLDPKKVSKNSNGQIVYDDTMASAVISYKIDRGLDPDSTVTKTMATLISSDVTNYRKLGSRTLTVNMSGTDVSELKNLLLAKGILKGKPKKKFENTTLDETTVEMLEAYLEACGFDWPGKIDASVIAFLKKEL